MIGSTKRISWAALFLLACAAASGCGGSNNGEGAKTAAAEKKVDDDPLALLPSSAIVMANIDAHAVYGSNSVGGVIATLTSRIVPFGEETGFVASRDLDRVIVGTYSLQGADVAAILVGKFDEQKIAQAAQARTPTKGGGVIVASQYGGRTLYTLNNVGFTVLSPKTVVCGTEAGIRRAIDRIRDGKVTRDQAPWMLQTLETKDAAFTVAADFATQPIAAASAGMLPLPWVNGMKAVRVVGNFHEPGLNVAGTVTYPDKARAEGAAGELKKTAAAVSLLSMVGAPQLKNLDIKPAESDTQVAFAVDDQQLRQFLQTLQQYLPQKL